MDAAKVVDTLLSPRALAAPFLAALVVSHQRPSV